MAFQSIQPVAFTFSPELAETQLECITIPFPKHWKEVFAQLQSIVSNRPIHKVKTPIASLNRTLRVLIPSIISISRDATSNQAIQNNQPWLYLRSSVDPVIIIRIVHAWAKSQFKDVDPAIFHQNIQRIMTHDITHQCVPLNLLDWSINSAGTALETNRAQYILLPDYLATIILERQHDGFYYGDQKISFRRSALPAGQPGAELTSWPPIEYDGALYSVVVHISVQTIPFKAEPHVQFDMSMRRWVGPNKAFIQGTAHAYMSASVPFIPDLDGWSDQLQRARLKRKKLGDDWITIWDDNLVDILADLGSPVSLFDPNHLTENPSQGWQDWDNAAAIVYSTRMGFHRLGAGVTIRERAQLFEQFASLFQDCLIPVDPYPRVEFRKQHKFTFIESAFSKPIKLTKNAQDEDYANINAIYAERRALLAATVGPELCIEIIAVNQALRENLIAALNQILGLNLSLQDKQVCYESSITITVRMGELASLAGNLELDTDNKKIQVVRDAIQIRVSEVQQQVPRAEIPTLTFMEILPKNSYAWLSDPKQSLRIGLARTGRVTQFITTQLEYDESQSNDEKGEKSTLEHRALSAVLDGLRQLGTIGDWPDTSPRGRGVNILAIWMMRRNSTEQGSKGYQVPVIVRLLEHSNVVEAISPGFDDWMPYRQALLKLAKIDALKPQGNATIDYALYIRAQIEDSLSPSADTLVLCQAQNLRSVWPWLANSRIVADAVSFDPKNPRTTIPIEDLPGLRIIRIRDAQGNETPEWFAQDDERQSASQGIFQIGERVFASIHEKPKQFTKYSHYFSKVEPWTSPKRPDKVHDAQPQKATWTPGLYELTVAALQVEDFGDPTMWVNLVHELRESNVQYTDATALPLPLHLAKLMDEYIIGLELNDYSGEDD